MLCRRLTEGRAALLRLSEPEIVTLAEAAIVRTFQKNTIVVTEGERSDSLYVILSGRVKVFVSDEDGRDSC